MYICYEHFTFHISVSGYGTQRLDYREGKELSWCPFWSNSLWQGWSCGLVHCPGGNATDPIWRELASSDGISSWTLLKPQHCISCWLSVQWEPSAYRSCQCCQKRDHQKFVGGFALAGLLGSRKASMLPLGTLSLGLWVIAVDPAFIALHFSKFKTEFYCISSSKVQIAFWKFSNCDNQALVGCISIPGVAVHLNVKS